MQHAAMRAFVHTYTPGKVQGRQQPRCLPSTAAAAGRYTAFNEGSECETGGQHNATTWCKGANRHATRQHQSTGNCIGLQCMLVFACLMLVASCKHTAKAARRPQWGCATTRVQPYRRDDAWLGLQAHALCSSAGCWRFSKHNQDTNNSTRPGRAPH